LQPDEQRVSVLQSHGSPQAQPWLQPQAVPWAAQLHDVPQLQVGAQL